MGAYLSQPDKTKETEEGANSHIEYAVSSMQGWRVNQEVGHLYTRILEGGRFLSE